MSYIEIPLQAVGLSIFIDQDNDEQHSEIATELSSEEEWILNEEPDEVEGMHILVEASVGEQLVNLIVDTGASQTVIDNHLIELDQYTIDEDSNIKSSSMNSALDIKTGVVRNFAVGGADIGSIKVGFTSMSTVNHMYAQVSAPKVVGLLGSDLLRKYKCILDYDKLLLKLQLL